MALRLFLLFTIVPALELWLLIKIGTIIGTFETIFVIILTGAVGANLARSQGLQVLNELNQAMQKGTSPARKVAEGLLILGGGLLLITPGVCTDIVGFSVMIPPFRAVLAHILQNILLNRIKMGTMKQMGGFPPQNRTEEVGTSPTNKQSPKDKPSSDWDHPIA
jgi:UPF0716 protein FxsA